VIAPAGEEKNEMERWDRREAGSLSSTVTSSAIGEPFSI